VPLAESPPLLEDDSPMSESGAASLAEELLDDEEHPSAPAAVTAAIADAAANLPTQSSLCIPLTFAESVPGAFASFFGRIEMPIVPHRASP
jgi:hypothetical protein